MASHTGENCHYETEMAIASNSSDDLHFIDLLDCSSLSNSDFTFDNFELSCDALPSTSSSEVFGASSMAIKELDNILKRKTENCTTPKHYSQKPSSKPKSKIVIKKGQRYLPSFKRKVLNYAAKHSFKKTAAKFHINCNTLTEWAREYKRLLLLKKSTTTRPGISIKTDKPGNSLKTDQTDPPTERPLTKLNNEAEFLQWLKQNRLDGCRLGRRELQNTGMTVLQNDSKTGEWFSVWINRLIKMGDGDGLQCLQKPEKHVFFPDSFKLEVALYGAMYTKPDAAKTFGVSTRRVYEWCERFDKPKKIPSVAQVNNKLLLSIVANSETEALVKLESEFEFLQWLKKKRLEGCQIGRKDLQLAGLAILQRGRNTSDWFTTWVNRLVELGDEKSLPVPGKTDKHVIFYPDNFKLEVAMYGEMYTKTEAARTFGVSSRRVYEWCDRFDKPKEDSARTVVEEKILMWYQGRCADGSRPKCLEIMSKARVFYAECGMPNVKCSQGWLDKMRKRLDIKLSHAGDDELLFWILMQLDNNVSLSLIQVTNKARELAISKGDKEFKGSKCWTLRFLKRHKHLLQSSSAKLADLPSMAVPQAKSFCLSLQQRLKAAALEPASLGCMDEIPINFVYPTETVPTPPLLRKANLEEAHAVILLAATSDGKVLPPAVVLKGPRAIQTFNAGETSVVILREETGMVDQETLRQWARHIWFPCVQAPSALVVDSFTPHLNKDLEEELSSGYCHLAVIPPGCAIHLHPCGFDLSRRFQEEIQEEWLKYTAMSSFPSWRTKAGPDEDDILNWVARAHLSLREDPYSIKCSFTLAGLTKPVDQVKSSP